MLMSYSNTSEPQCCEVDFRTSIFNVFDVSYITIRRLGGYHPNLQISLTKYMVFDVLVESRLKTKTALSMSCKSLWI